MFLLSALPNSNFVYDMSWAAGKSNRQNNISIRIGGMDGLEALYSDMWGKINEYILQLPSLGTQTPVRCAIISIW